MEKVTRNLKHLGVLSFEQIAQATDLSVDEIAAL
jgi:predicted flap endonuclease-1-like 5' DNA nuclease